MSYDSDMLLFKPVNYYVSRVHLRSGFAGGSVEKVNIIDTIEILKRDTRMRLYMN